ncbi:MAG: dihydroorotate dehydrogenase (quinone), partial [Flavobacteriaceae bacterium]|nr:dihydroorotate dehydrogenase (quinone) [Flavobacteriaceae bacterium]
MYQSIIKKILFLFDPEKIHHFSFTMIRWSSKIPG